MRAGLPVPPFAVVHRRASRFRRSDSPRSASPPQKMRRSASSSARSFDNPRALAARVDAMHEGWDEVLVQRYIAGREVNVGIVGDHVLPVAEIDFSAMPERIWRIVSYRSKWDTGSDEDVGAGARCPADLPEALSAEVEANRARRVARSSAARDTAAWTCGSMRTDSRGSSRSTRTPISHRPPDSRAWRAAAGLDYGALVRSSASMRLDR